MSAAQKRAGTPRRAWVGVRGLAAVGSLVTAVGFASTHDEPVCGDDEQCQQLVVRLSRTGNAPSTARKSLDGFAHILDASLLDDLRLLVSELVTNSFRHAALDTAPIGLRLEVADTVVHVEVSDNGPGFTPPTTQPPATATAGRGLPLVRALSDRWGVTTGPPHRVWCQVDHQHGTRPAEAARFGADPASASGDNKAAEERRVTGRNVVSDD